MQKELFEQWTSASKNVVKPMVALNTIASRIFERFVKQGLDVFSDAVATNVAYVQTLANAKKPEDAVAVQAKAFKEHTGKIARYSQETLEVFVDSSAELSKWFEDGVAQTLANNPVVAAASAAATDKKTTTGSKA